MLPGKDGHLPPASHIRARREGNLPVSADQEQKVEMTAADAARILGIGENKLAQLLKGGQDTQEQGLPFRQSRLDRRVRLVRRSDVEGLLRLSQGTTVQEARRQLGISREKMKSLIDEGTLPVRLNPLHRNRPIVDQATYEELLAERDARSRHHA